MKNNRVSVGLDIGTTKIVVMVGRAKEDSTVEIIGIGQSQSTGVNKGVIQNISKTISAIRESVAMAEESSGIKIKDVTVGIAGQHIRSERQTDYITRPQPHKVIDQSDIDRLKEQVLKFPLSEHERIIHVLPQEFKVDAEAGILEPIGMSGSRLEATFHIVIGQVSALLNVKRCVEGAGLNLAGLKLEPIASSDAVLTEEEKEAGVVLVDIGGGTTDLVVTRDDLIRHSAVIPYAGKVLTNDIKEACSILGKYAEKLKKDFGSTWPGANKETDIVSIPVLQGLPPKEVSMRSLSRIIYARMDEILDDINSEIANYRKIEPNKNLIGGIVITGGGSLLKHLPEFVFFKTQMSCRIGYPNIYLAEENRECLTSPVYSTCIGLVLNGLKDLPEEQEEEQEEIIQTSVLNLEKETVELPIEEVIPAIVEQTVQVFPEEEEHEDEVEEYTEDEEEDIEEEQDDDDYSYSQVEIEGAVFVDSSDDDQSQDRTQEDEVEQDTEDEEEQHNEEQIVQAQKKDTRQIEEQAQNTEKLSQAKPVTQIKADPKPTKKPKQKVAWGKALENALLNALKKIE